MSYSYDKRLRTGLNVAAVTVNSSAATLYGDHTFASTNNTLANGNNTFAAVAADGYGRTSTDTVTAYLPATNSFVYDANGNLTSDGQRSFAYDDENQLISVWVTNVWRSDFVYDGKMRRRIRFESIGQGTNWVTNAVVRYVYDKNIVIQERDANNLPVVTYTRGKDLSGSLEGAGGIGGLLSRTDNHLSTIGDSGAYAYYHADGNGNVTCLVNSKQAIVAEYLYDPFGSILAERGLVARENLYRYSSEEFHAKSGMVHYLYRNYAPNLQRWITKDPLGEAGFEARRLRRGLIYMQDAFRYDFVRNQPVGSVDFAGLEIFPGGVPPPTPSSDPCPCGENLAALRRLGIRHTWRAYQDSEDAMRAARDSHLPGAISGQADAFRHCVWSCLMAQHIGPEEARDMGNIHERCEKGQDPGDEAMDRANNAVGVALGTPGANCVDACRQALRDGRLQRAPVGGTSPTPIQY